MALLFDVVTDANAFMSIAVSAVIRPSRYLAFFNVGFAGFFVLTGVLAMAGQLGPFPFYGRVVLMPVCLTAALVLVLGYFKTRKTLRIDISGNGQIRLKEYRGNEFDASAKSMDSPEEQPYELMEKSTIWPGLLILLLRTETGKKAGILIFPDAVQPGEFQSLYTACRWIDAHKKN